MFTVDNRPEFNGTKRLACQQITPSQCGACLVEDDATAGRIVWASVLDMQ